MAADLAELLRKAAIESMARELMIQHGLPVTGPGAWGFRWDRSKTREGVCKYGPRVIGMSWPVAQIRTLDQSRDVVLHEIAHALAGYEAAHGTRWKAIARKVGAVPKACSDGERPAMRYTGRCGHGHTAQRDRLTDNAHTAWCTKCWRLGRRVHFTWTEN